MVQLLALLLFLAAGYQAGCRRASEADEPSPSPPPSATPEIGVTLATLAAPTANVIQITPSPLPTSTSTPTATPIIYAIQEGDTLLGIAIQRATSLEQILALNPGVTPELLQIGQRIILPPPATPVFQDAAATAIPLRIAVTDLSLYRTPVGSLWILGEVTNEGEFPAETLQVEITLVDLNGEALQTAVAWVVPGIVPAGGKAPFGVHLDQPSDAVDQARAAIIGGGTLVSLGNRTLDLAVEEATMNTSEEQVIVEGQLRNTGQVTVSQISLVVTLYDGAGKVSGYRELLLTGTLEADESVPYTVSISPPGGPAVSFSVAVQGLVAASG